MTAPSPPWWRNAVVYQVYIRSFADGNGDGTGDLAGLRSRLGYLRSLGVTAVWVNPWYRSPLVDGGYDVADYRDIDPRFGDLGEAERFIAEAHDSGLRVLADLVPNHTSSQHPWFRAALAGGPGNPARARYHFAPGRGPGGGEPPTDWRSVFGGPAWSRVPDGEWYLHLFDPEQPDLNWAEASVRSEFVEIIEFWLDRGIDGFRVDVAHGLAKDPDYPDLGTGADGGTSGRAATVDHPFWDRNEVHEITEQWRAVLERYPGDRMLVAEAWVANRERLGRYLVAGRYHQAFDFDFLTAPWDSTTMRTVIKAAIDGSVGVGGTPTWVLSNHDVMRVATRFGLPVGVDPKQWLVTGGGTGLDSSRGLRRARAAALLMLALPGSVYLYQGEELGLPEVWDLPVEVLDDPVWRRSGKSEKGRDGCRVPLPWHEDGPSFGFGTGSSWLPQPPGWGGYSVAAQERDPSSTLAMFRAALAIRSERMGGDEQLVWMAAPGATTIDFVRGSGLRCVVNLGERPSPRPVGQVLLASDPEVGSTLPPDTAVWLV